MYYVDPSLQRCGSPYTTRSISNLYREIPYGTLPCFLDNEKKESTDVLSVTKSIERLSIAPNYEKKKNKIRIKPEYKSRYSPRPPSGKYWWKDELGRDVAAGGILILDTLNGKEGVWTISEKSRRGYGFEYTDVGGRYHFDDGDIYATIGREFREEMYNTDEIPYELIKRLASSPSREDKFVYRMVKGKYMCLVVHRRYLNTLNLNDDLVQEAKHRVLRENPYISPCFYRTEHVVFLPFDQVKQLRNDLSFRLNDILFNSPLRAKLNTFHIEE